MGPQIFICNTELHFIGSNSPMIEINYDTIKQLKSSPSYNYNNLPFFSFNYAGLSDDIRQYLLNLPCNNFLIKDNINILLSLKINNNSSNSSGFIEYLQNYDINT